MARELLRSVRLTAHDGYRYTLTLRDSGEVDSRGRTRIAYRLTWRGPNAEACRAVVLFEGADFSGSPMHADDSDDSVAGLLSFLTCRPGDTDPEYFASYTQAQLDWCEQHAEYLSYAVMERFGER